MGIACSHAMIMKLRMIRAAAAFFALIWALVGFVACDARTGVEGTVVDNDGNPIPGTSVRLTLVANGRTREMTTTQDGKFLVQLIHGPFAGRFDLTVSRSGYGDYRQQIPAKTSQTLRIALIRTETHAPETIESDSYAVYSALLTQQYRVWFRKNKSVQIAARTIPPDRSHGDYLARCSADANDETDRQLIQRLLSQVDQKGKLEAKLNLPGQYVLVEGKPSIQEGVEPGIVTLSSVVFSADAKRAFVWVGNSCGGLCGTGLMWRLDKTAQGWRPSPVHGCGFIS